MTTKVTSLVLALILITSSTPSANADLIALWQFDGDARDSSGNGHHGTLQGDPQFVEGVYNEAVELDGDDYVVMEGFQGTLGPQAMSLCTWVRSTGSTGTIASWGDPGSVGFLFWIWQNRLTLHLNQANFVQADTQITDGEWHHAALVVVENASMSKGDVTIYMDGQDDTRDSSNATVVQPEVGFDVTVGASADNPSQRPLTGLLDDVFLFDTALTPDQVERVMNGGMRSGSHRVFEPMPLHEQTDVLREVVLNWASESAARYNVYMGTVLDAVSDASVANPSGVLVSQEQTDMTYDAGVLEFGQTYYWRVDEVNGAPDYTVTKGPVWHFEVEPFSLPVPHITATASSFHDADMVAEKTIDGSGLDAWDQHSNSPRDMWLSGMGDPVPSIQYAFDRAYKLHELWVWNSNQSVEGFLGLGARDVSIEISLSGTDWTQLEDVPPFAQAPGTPGYAHNTTIDLGGALAQYVRLAINAGHGVLPQSGLSEVRFWYIPTYARAGQPADGDTTDRVDPDLSWRAGREAASHEVYLGTDPNALALADTVTNNAYHPTDLDYATTYFWQVVEVNDAEVPSSYVGPVWPFSTPAYSVVEDFDQYDDDCQRIFFAWRDGMGHNGGKEVDDCAVPAYNGNGTGSMIGNASSPFAEQTIVRSGQSLSLYYDNAGVNTAEAQYDLAPAQDWTVRGIRSLALYFRGDPDNTGQLYVKINNTKIAYDGLPDALQQAQWTPWNIDLSTVAGNLQSVTRLAIGVEGAGATGVVYVDDIRVYPLAPEFVTPMAPAPANLVAHYPFEGNANDSAGGLHGTLMGSAGFAPGPEGQALNLNTLSATDYVEITGYQGILGTSAITVAAWINTSNTATSAIIGWGPNVSGQRFGFRINAGRLRMEHHGGNIQGGSVVNDGTWHHVAVTIEADATLSYPEVRLWLDGRDDTRRGTDPDAFDLTADLDVSIGRRPAGADRHFVGQIDELYIYDRVLSQAEIAGLAGMTQPFAQPFD